jgi:hypothetical protein
VYVQKLAKKEDSAVKFQLNRDIKLKLREIANISVNYVITNQRKEEETSHIAVVNISNSPSCKREYHIGLLDHFYMV